MLDENDISAEGFKAHGLIFPSLFGWMKGTVIEQGNIIDPIDCIWEAAQ